MQKMEWNISMDEEVLCLKKKLVDTLLSDSLIQAWINDNGVSEDIVKDHAYKFKDYLEAKNKCISCIGLASCMQKTKGHILIPKVDRNALSLHLMPCEYMKQKKLKLAHAKQFLYCDMSEVQLNHSFDHIDLMKESSSYISVVNEMMKEAKYHEKGKGFYLCGEPGTGKTYLACCFVNEVAKQGKKCAFVNVSAFLSSLKTKINDKDAYQKQIDAIRKADVAVLDDIGGESISNWSRDEILLPLLNERMEKGLLTIFTSNYNMENLEKYYAINSKILNDQVGAKRVVERMKALSFEKVLNCRNRRAEKSGN